MDRTTQDAILEARKEKSPLQFVTVLWRAYVPVCWTGVRFEPWYVIKYTPKGYWITSYRETPEDVFKYDVPRKWVPHDAKFVSPSKEEALLRLLRRKESHVRHARRRYKEAQRQLQVVSKALSIDMTTDEPLCVAADQPCLLRWPWDKESSVDGTVERV